MPNEEKHLATEEKHLPIEEPNLPVNQSQPSVEKDKDHSLDNVSVEELDFSDRNSSSPASSRQSTVDKQEEKLPTTSAEVI